MHRALAWTMLAVGVVADLAAWFGLLAKDEPQTVVHLSTLALIFSGLDGVLVAEKE